MGRVIRVEWGESYRAVYGSVQTAGQNAMGSLVNAPGGSGIRHVSELRSEIVLRGKPFASYEDVSGLPESEQCPEGWIDSRVS